MAVETEQAQVFLSDQFGAGLSDVVLVGEGAWSRCFGFQRGNEKLVIRFGQYVEDFWKDRLAYSFTAPDLPIPEVLEIGEAFDGYFAVSRRVHGVPLESLTADQWLATVPSVVAALEAMRMTTVPSTLGVGGWGRERTASHATWSSYLLAVGDDTPDRRIHGWRDRLAASPQGDEAFTRGFALLQSVVNDAVPSSLLHCDLVNRNVLVDNHRITGVFDWGCSLYGDHLYELAWLEFWAPWFPRLDIQSLRVHIEQRWRDAGYAPDEKESRLVACYLHIGLEHLAYNAHLGDWPALAATTQRMQTLATNKAASFHW